MRAGRPARAEASLNQASQPISPTFPWRGPLRFLVFLPVLIQAALAFRGIGNWVPVWAWYADPGYQYLLAGASLISGGEPALVYHPGTSFQWLVGIAEVAHHALTGDGPFFSDLVAEPETYARSAASLVAVLYVSALAFVAWRLLRSLGPWPSLAFQFMMLWGLPVLAGARFHLWPESLVLVCALLSIGLLAQCWARGPASLPASSVILLGVTSALGVTAKAIFLPVIVVVALSLPWRRTLVYVASLAGASAIIHVPIVSRLPAMWTWFKSIATTPGRHGQLVETSWQDNFAMGQTVLAGYLRWYLPAVAILAVVLTLLIAARRSIRDPLSRGIVAVSLGIVLVVLSTFKQSEIRDLVVIVPLLASLTALLFTLAISIVSIGNLRRVLVIGMLCGTGFLALHGLVHAGNFSGIERRQTNGIVRDSQAVTAAIDDGRWALGYNVWTEQNALMFGSNDGLMLGVEYSDDLVNREIAERFPRALYFDLWNRNVQAISEDSRLTVLPCPQLGDFLATGPLGIVVESSGNLEFDRGGTEVVLSDGRATFRGPSKIGQYLAFEFTSLKCDEEVTAF